MNIESDRSVHPILQNFLQILPGLSEMLGPNFEVILHDLRYPDSSIIGISGSVTGRTIGSPITNYVLSIIRSHGDSAPNRINYRNETADGRVFRSSTLFIRDESWKIIGCLCFNSDISFYLKSIDALRCLTSFNTTTSPSEANNVDEHFATDISDLMRHSVMKILNMHPIPVTDMKRSEKLCVVSELEENGIFNIKGSVEYVSTCLRVSTPTMYNYLKEIKK